MTHQVQAPGGTSDPTRRVFLVQILNDGLECRVERRRGLPERVAVTQDDIRVTEEGPVAIALALAARHRQWRVVRCLQSRLGEGADWLLEDTTGSFIVLEVGGTDSANLGALLARKVAQVRRSIFAGRATLAACVVRFADPRALLEYDDAPR